jgi:hypothetical protein
MKILEANDLITSLRKAALSEKDSATIMAVFKTGDMINTTEEGKSVTNIEPII